MSVLELREVPASEAMTFARVAELGFGSVATDEEARATATEIYDPEWSIGVYDAGQLVATASATTVELTLPAGSGQPFPVVTVPAVTGVTVLPTHRRQGLLNQMMDYQLDQFRRRGVRLAILTASESVIYGRYGYGLASSCQSLSIATRRSAFVRPVEGGGRAGMGRLRLVGAAEAATILPAVHEQARRLRPGDISRSKEVWEATFRDPERHRQGGGSRIYVVHESPEGDPDGYATYRYRHNWSNGLPAHSIPVEDIYATSPAVDAALWRFLLDLDLVEEVTTGMRPLDEPLRWRLADPRRLRTTGIYDFLWARLVEIPAALAVRGYSAETELVLEVEGPPTERVALATGASGGSCRQAGKGEKSDLRLGLGPLGAIFLGGSRPSVLAAAGLIEEARPGALARADAAFASPVVPFCGTRF
jgi:predicted acetyltransferase